MHTHTSHTDTFMQTCTAKKFSCRHTDTQAHSCRYTNEHIFMQTQRLILFLFASSILRSHVPNLPHFMQTPKEFFNAHTDTADT